jgi:hypothetical protein
MKVCDSCSAIVECLLDTSIYVGLKNGDWASVNAELCPNCRRKLVDMEREAREHAILKSHKEFMDGMKGNEALLHRPIKRVTA